jgi:replicative DNA helicase
VTEELMSSVLYSAEGEEAVLGCMLAQPSEVIPLASSSLQREDFFVPAHKELFRIMVAMFDKTQAVDAMTVHHQLEVEKLDKAVGSPGILAEIYTGFASHLNVSSYIKIVKEKSLLRCLQLACSTIVQDIADMPDSVVEVLDRAESTIFKVTHSLDTKPQISSVRDALARFVANQAKVQIGEVQSRLQTGFREFDAMNGGLMPEGMHVIAGRPGSGKSDFMFCALRNIAKRGLPVGILQLEMTEGMMIERLMADEASIDSRRFHAPMSLPEWDRVYASEIESSKWPMFIECGAGFDINKIRRSIRALVAKGCKVIMLDYLQLAKSLETKYGNREQALAEVSRTIKGFTLEFGIAVLVGSQLNRLDAGGKQGLHNLRESDSIGNDADVVIVLRKKTPDDESLKPQMIIDVAKYRNGAAGEIVMIFDMARHRFEDFQLPAQRPLYDPAP